MSLTTRQTDRPSSPFRLDEAEFYRLTMDRYHRMIRAGILGEDDPVELLEGVLVARMPRNASHRGATHRARRVLQQRLPPGWYVDSQEPITLGASEPEPDVIVVRGGSDDFLERHPQPGEVALVIEVADSTLRRDRDWKQRIYAEAGIPTYWIVNLVDACLEVYTQPEPASVPPAYGRRRTLRAGEEIAVELDGRLTNPIPVESLLPPD